MAREQLSATASPTSRPDCNADTDDSGKISMEFPERETFFHSQNISRVEQSAGVPTLTKSVFGSQRPEKPLLAFIKGAESLK